MRTLGIGLLVLAHAALVCAAPLDPLFAGRVGEAIARSVATRMGPNTAVRVESLSITATPAAGPIDVTPAPDARTGRASLYSLTVTTPAGPRRIGSAMATVHVEADVLRATRALSRGEELSEGDVVAGRGPAVGVALKRLPVASEALGARVVRAVDDGAVLSVDVLAVPYSVRSGQQVRLRALVDGILAQGMGVATENGRIGAVIRVVNPESKKALTGRVIGPGQVEVIHGS